MINTNHSIGVQPVRFEVRSAKGRSRLAGALLALLVTATTWCTNVAAGALPVAAVSASSDDGNVPANTLDGSLATRWSAAGDGQWIAFDLGSSQSVGSVNIAWYKGDQRRFPFDIQTSDTGR